MKAYNSQSGVYCLNRGWKFSDKDYSVLPESTAHSDVYGFAKAGAAGGPACAVFDDTGWQAVTLPHDWVTAKKFDETAPLNFGYKSRGIGWYRVKFRLEEEDIDKQILLEFEGMSSDSEIYCNGMLMKRNHSGYNSFCLDMTDMANFGPTPNIVAVRIDATKWEGWWYEGAGIYRNVWLVKKDPVHIGYNGSWVNPQNRGNGQWDTVIETTVENSGAPGREFSLVFILRDAAGNEIARAGNACSIPAYATLPVSQTIRVCNPLLWEIDSPNLYELETRIVYKDETKDFLKTKFGFRSLEMSAETGFWINGKNVKLKGFCNHQDHAGVGAAVPYAVKEYRVGLLKSMGANAYRLAHNPDPEILEICDRLGMITMNENRTFSTEEENLRGVAELVKNSRNHPSVGFYSVFNEEPLQGTAKGRRLAGRLQAAIKALDNTRFVLGAFNGGFMESQGAATVLDVVGMNYAMPKYDDFHAKYPKTPLLGSETCSSYSVRGAYVSDNEKHIIDNYDESFAPWGASVRQTWQMVCERPFVAGSFVWTGFDYGGEPSPFQWPSVSSYFGTLDRCGFPKDAYYLYQSLWLPTPVVHLLPHWTLALPEGTPVKVMVFSNCDEIELRLNHNPIATGACDRYQMVTFTVPYEPGILEAYGKKAGAVVAQAKQETCGACTGLKLTLSKSSLLADGRDAAIINVFGVDDAGRVVPDAENLIQFQITGGGRLLGVGNGSPTSHEPDNAPYRRLFHGCAQLIIGNSGAGDVTVTASAQGVESASVCLSTLPTEQIPYVNTVDEQVVEGWKIYHKLYDEMPQLDFKLAENDMNTFEPVSFEGVPQPIFTNQYGKYGVYRVVISLPPQPQSLFFERILGDVWVYWDGALLASRISGTENHFTVPLPPSETRVHTLYVIVKNTMKTWSKAGICIPVRLVRDKSSENA